MPGSGSRTANGIGAAPKTTAPGGPDGALPRPRCRSKNSAAAATVGTFVTRQSSAVVLRGLAAAGLITRPAAAEHGRALPVHLTEAGQARLRAARSAVYAVEARMIAPSRRPGCERCSPTWTG